MTYVDRSRVPVRSEFRAGLAFVRHPVLFPLTLAILLTNAGFVGPMNIGMAELSAHPGWGAAGIGLMLAGFGLAAAATGFAFAALGATGCYAVCGLVEASALFTLLSPALAHGPRQQERVLRGSTHACQADQSDRGPRQLHRGLQSPHRHPDERLRRTDRAHPRRARVARARGHRRVLPRPRRAVRRLPTRRRRRRDDGRAAPGRRLRRAEGRRAPAVLPGRLDPDVRTLRHADNWRPARGRDPRPRTQHRRTGTELT